MCDNPTLKQVLKDVKAEKVKELEELQEKRNNELKTVLNDVAEEENVEVEVSSDEPKEEVSNEIEKEEVKVELEIPSEEENKIELEVPVVDVAIETEIKEEPKVELEIPSVNLDLNIEPKDEIEVPSSDIVMDTVINETPVEEVKPIFDISEDIKPEEENNNLINIDTILSEINVTGNEEVKEETVVTPDLNVVNTEPITMPENNFANVNSESKIKIIFEKDVPEVLLKDIYSSSKIMPVVYDYLDGKSEGGVN